MEFSESESHKPDHENEILLLHPRYAAGHEKEYLDMVLKFLQESQKGSLDSLKSENLGSLLTYGIIYIMNQANQVLNDATHVRVKTYLEKLSNETFFNELDLMLAVKMLGLNDFNNLIYGSNMIVSQVLFKLDHDFDFGIIDQHFELKILPKWPS